MANTADGYRIMSGNPYVPTTRSRIHILIFSWITVFLPQKTAAYVVPKSSGRGSTAITLSSAQPG